MQGLNQPEMRLLAEKVSNQPETWDIEDKLVEFALPSWQVITEYSKPEYEFVVVTDFERSGGTRIQGGNLKFYCHWV